MTTVASTLVQKLWNFCQILRDDGVSYGDYVEQLTYLLFLKMAYERTLDPSCEPPRIPVGISWPSLVKKDGDDLKAHYQRILEQLGSEEGMLGLIFHKAINKIQNPAHLRRLIVELMNTEQWISMKADVLGDAYEGLLQKSAEDTKSGAGQYFTPRPLIEAIVEVMRPEVGQTICDPASGTGGFLLAALFSMSGRKLALSYQQQQFLKNRTFQGWEIVDSTARLCGMNMFLHGIGDGNESYSCLHVADSLLVKPVTQFDLVLSNPPFGRGKSSRLHRQDLWAVTNNKQLNFLQHIFTLLKEHGRAAVVVPDNVLFEGGAGETIRRNLLQNCDVHTMLRLPTGIFYAQGVKANVLLVGCAHDGFVIDVGMGGGGRRDAGGDREGWAYVGTR